MKCIILLPIWSFPSLKEPPDALWYEKKKFNSIIIENLLQTYKLLTFFNQFNLTELNNSIYTPSLGKIYL